MQKPNLKHIIEKLKKNVDWINSLKMRKISKPIISPPPSSSFDRQTMIDNLERTWNKVEHCGGGREFVDSDLYGRWGGNYSVNLDL